MTAKRLQVCDFVKVCRALDLIDSKRHLLNDFERCLVDDRRRAVLKYRERAMFSEKQLEIIYTIENTISKTCAEIANEVLESIQ
jgi:hypothetical protein